MPEGQPVYVVNMRPFYEARDQFTIDKLAVQCLEVIRTEQESGPYYLCGYSFGGCVAYEIAATLEKRREDVGLLVLFDAANPAFRSNLSTAESARFRATYISNRIGKYYRNLFSGNFTALISDAAAFFLTKLGPIWPLVAHSFKIMGKPLPAIVKNNDPIVVAACQVYTPSPYAGRLVLFRSLGRGPEYNRDATLGWDKYVTGSIDVHPVPGDHIYMMTRPNVSSIVETLERYLYGDSRPLAGPAPAGLSITTTASAKS